MQVHEINLKYQFGDFRGWMQNEQYVFHPDFLAHIAKLSALLLSIIIVKSLRLGLWLAELLSSAPKYNCHTYAVIENCATFI